MTGLLSKIYGIVVNLRNWLYDKKILPSKRVGKIVISVGNLTVGGTGKTPFVLMLAHLMKGLGMKPAIVSGGYKRTGKGEVIVSDGQQIKAKLSETGDEMMMIARKIRTPVVVHNTKTKAAISVTGKFDIDSIIVDDGFQHRKLYRDLNILILDNSALRERHLIPKGRLRENFKSIRKADVICFIGKADLSKSQKEYLSNEQLIIRAIGHFGKPYFLTTKKDYNFDFNDPRKSISVLTAIANPERFKSKLERLNFKIDKTFIYPDHYDYNERTLTEVSDKLGKGNNRFVATTEKDAVKLFRFKHDFSRLGIRIVVFPYYLRLVHGKQALINLLKAKIYIR